MHSDSQVVRFRYISTARCETRATFVIGQKEAAATVVGSPTTFEPSDLYLSHFSPPSIPIAALPQTPLVTLTPPSKITASQMEYQPGDVVPFHFSPGLVVASFFVSLTGCITAVELLHRREASKGFLSWFELGSCAISMGLVGIWAMHYVGNRSIILGDGSSRLQLLYNPGFTALSCFIPIITLFFAFLLADRRFKGSMYLIASIIFSGLCAGLATCGMHYSGNLGVANYDIGFDPRYVGGAIAIACFSSIMALTLMFVLQEMWLDILPWRIVCAFLLAGAVSSMHWEASTGTVYRLKFGTPIDELGTIGTSWSSRNANFIIAVVLSLSTIPVCAIITLANARRRKQVHDRAQQVILACARFDSDGRLMLTHEGHLPSSKLTSFQDEFDVTHPAFHWIFRASRNWSSVSRYIPTMRRHLRAAQVLTSPSRTMDSIGLTDPIEMPVHTTATEDFSIIFREGFCVAASDIAAELRVSVADLGTLYDQVMTTGTVRKRSDKTRGRFARLKTAARVKISDVEASGGVDLFGKGKLLVLTHQCDRRETVKLVSEGYRFVAPDKIVDLLARTLQVPSKYLTHHLMRMRTSIFLELSASPTGILLGCFVLKPGIAKQIWDVMVPKDCPDRLPHVQLSSSALNGTDLGILQQLDGLTVTACLELLNEEVVSGDLIDSHFAVLLRRRILQLTIMVSESFFQRAIFSSKMIRVPTFNAAARVSSFYNLLIFHIIPDIHGSSLHSSSTLTYTPLSFFLARQQILREAPHHASFKRKVHHEFAGLFPQAQMQSLTKHVSTNGEISTSLPYSTDLHRPRISRLPLDSVHSFGSKVIRMSKSQNHDYELEELTNPEMSLFPYGGIMLSQDFTIELLPLEQNGETTDTSEMGASCYAGTADAELPTYVGELFSIAVETWRRADKKAKE